jgi:hypothetical protein
MTDASSTTTGASTTIAIAAGAGGGGVALILALILTLFLCRRRRRHPRVQELQPSVDQKLATIDSNASGTYERVSSLLRDMAFDETAWAGGAPAGQLGEEGMVFTIDVPELTFGGDGEGRSSDAAGGVLYDPLTGERVLGSGRYLARRLDSTYMAGGDGALYVARVVRDGGDLLFAGDNQYERLPGEDGGNGKGKKGKGRQGKKETKRESKKDKGKDKVAAKAPALPPRRPGLQLYAVPRAAIVLTHRFWSPPEESCPNPPSCIPMGPPSVRQVAPMLVGLGEAPKTQPDPREAGAMSARAR